MMNERYFDYDPEPRSLKIIPPTKPGLYVYMMLLDSGSQFQLSVIRCQDGNKRIQSLQPELRYE